MVRRKIEGVRLQIAATESLRALKRLYSYSVLGRELKLPAAVMSRYVNGLVLPSPKRAAEILTLVKGRWLTQMISSSVGFCCGVLDVSRLLSNVELLRLAAIVVAEESSGRGVDVVLTKEADGIPFATLVSEALGSRLVVAKSKKEPGVRSFVESTRKFSSGLYEHVYVPRTLMPKGSRVLIIDDIIRSGSTVEALVSLTRSSGSSCIGIYALVSLADEGLEERLGVPVKFFAKLPFTS